MQLEFAKSHHKIIPRGKSGHGLGLWELPKILRFHFNVYTIAEARNFKFGTQLGFAKAHHKTTLGGKWAGPWAREAPRYFSSSLVFLQWPRCPLSISGASCCNQLTVEMLI